MSTSGFPVPVFAVAGAGAWGPVQELRGRRELSLVSTPRHAAVLLVAGAIPADHREALDRVHDQLPHPRAAVGWETTSADHVVSVNVDGHDDDVVAAIVDAHRAVMADRRTTAGDRLPDTEPNEWRGVGPFGQGGEGMMGGTPYGRPMAMTGDDRDGLTLDRLQLRLGPFLQWLPAGVVLDVTLQGEILQTVHPVLAAPDPGTDIASLETGPVTATRRGLRWLALGLHVHGLDALAARAARVATASVDDPGSLAREFGRLRRSIQRSGLLWSIRGIGGIDGLGDAADRWRHRLSGIADALGSDAPVDDPALHLAWDALGEALVGSTVTDAVTTVVSLHDRLVVPTEVLGS